MVITRRQVLAGMALLTAAGAAGATLTVVRWWAEPADTPYLRLSAHESEFFSALAEAVFPTGGVPALGGGEAAVPRYLDRVLVGLAPTQHNLLRVGIHALDNLARTHHGRRFVELEPAAAQDQLRAWLASDVAPLRGLVQTLHLFVAMAYTAHPAVAHHLRPLFNCGFGEAEAAQTTLAPG